MSAAHPRSSPRHHVGRRGLLSLGCSILLATSGCAMIEKIPPLPTKANRLKAEQQKVALAKLSEERGSEADARHIYEEVIKKNPEHQEAHRRLAIMATKEGKFAEADAHFQKAWAIGPQTTTLLCDMGYRLYLEHRLTEAEALLRQAVEREPQNAVANNNLGLVLGQLNRFDEALQCFRRVNGEAEAHANMGYVLAQLGRNQEAAFAFNQALTNDPSMRSAANGLLAITGNLKQLPAQSPMNPQSPGLDSPQAIAAQQPNGGSFPNPGGPADITHADPQRGWQPLTLTEGKATLNPAAPSLAANWQGPIPPSAPAQQPSPSLPGGPQYAAQQAPPPGYYSPRPSGPPQPYTNSPSAATNGVQPTAYWSANQNRSEAAYYQGPAAPYGGQQMGGPVPADLSPGGLPAQFSNGIPANASSTLQR